ncbi:PH domain-containing protein DDB_G0287875-like [Varroa destructor]|uniref:Tudor domain-containing protein n=1 Tax=Varroa destructor TaxID=109461 RepID=A0A7M7KUC4_VARDE|nr:PH domain-containing protein DDB_G0287875-like [Varroa destructor]
MKQTRLSFGTKRKDSPSSFSNNKETNSKNDIIVIDLSENSPTKSASPPTKKVRRTHETETASLADNVPKSPVRTSARRNTTTTSADVDKIESPVKLAPMQQSPAKTPVKQSLVKTPTRQNPDKISSSHTKEPQVTPLTKKHKTSSSQKDGNIQLSSDKVFRSPAQTSTRKCSSNTSTISASNKSFTKNTSSEQSPVKVPYQRTPTKTFSEQTPSKTQPQSSPTPTPHSTPLSQTSSATPSSQIRNSPANRTPRRSKTEIAYEELKKRKDREFRLKEKEEKIKQREFEKEKREEERLRREQEKKELKERKEQERLEKEKKREAEKLDRERKKEEERLEKEREREEKEKLRREKERKREEERLEKGRERIDNYVISVADAKCPVVRISTELLRVGHPTIAPTYVEKYPYCTVFPEPNERRPQQPSDEKVFIAEVNEIDIVPRHMRMFITIIDRIGERDRLQKKLQSTYGRNKNQTIPLNQLRKGLPCAVPFEGTQDFHRAVILRPVVSRLVQVLYVDFGTVADVVSESLIFLDEDFYKVPVLAEPAVLSFAVPWKDRRGVADKILKQSSVKMIVLGWSEEQNSIIVQVSDLASYPMKLRSELRAA